MEARIKNAVALLPDAMQALQVLGKVVENSELPPHLAQLVHLRASQMNGCSSCVYGGVIGLQKAGETNERIATIAAWRDTPFFSEAERAALALTEAVTHLNETDPVPDAIWNEAVHHYNEKQLAALLLAITNTNVFNRLNVAMRQVAGAWMP